MYVHVLMFCLLSDYATLFYTEYLLLRGMAQYYSQQQQQYRSKGTSKPELPRSISNANLVTTHECQELVQKDWCPNAPSGGTNFFFSLTGYTFTLPTLSSYPADFCQFVFECFIDRSAKKTLEEERCLNWCPNAAKLEPLHTLGDGNCLLHAASLGMWGFQDRAKILRNAVSHAVMNAYNNNTFYQRWYCTKIIEHQQIDLELEQQQWQKEWQNIVQQASTDLTANSILESLEEFHVFVLANILRRPVIMYASQKMRSLHTGGTLQNTNFHGIYLPLLWDPLMCTKEPLPLAYQNGHFSSLVAAHFADQYRDGKLALPLVTFSGEPLPVRFILSSEQPGFLVKEYLSLVNIPGLDHQSTIRCAVLNINDKPAYYDRFVGGFLDVCYDAFIQQQQPHYSTSQMVGRVNTHQGGGMSGNGTGMQPYHTTGHMLATPDPTQAMPHTTPAGMMHTNTTYPPADPARDSTTIPREPLQSHGQQQGEQIKCINDCGAFGDAVTGLCPKCYKRSLEAAQEIEKPSQQLKGGTGSALVASLTGSIKCSHCSKPGHPQYLGMCESCYGTSQQNQQLAQPQYGNQGAQPQYGNQLTRLEYGNQPAQPQYGNQPHRPQAVHGMEQGGLPNNLYESIENYQGGNAPQQAPKTPPPVPPPRPTDSGSSRNQCRTPNCIFFGTAETRFYCSKCFEKNMVDILKEVDAPPKRDEKPLFQPPSNQTAPRPYPYEVPISGQQEKCTACHNFFGSQEYNGLCHGCFMANPTATDSKKCTSCNTFFGSEEYGGFCHGCFMKRTMVEPNKPSNDVAKNRPSVTSQPPNQQENGFSFPQPAFDFSSHSQSNLPPQPQGYVHGSHTQPHTQYRPQEHRQQAPQNYNYSQIDFSGDGGYPQAPTVRPTPKPRSSVRPAMQGYIAPLNPVIPAESRTVNCFICRGTNPGAAGEYAVCPQHAKLMTEQILKAPLQDAVPEREVKLKPQPMLETMSQYSSHQLQQQQHQQQWQQQQSSTGYIPNPPSARVSYSHVAPQIVRSSNAVVSQAGGPTPQQHYPPAAGTFNNLDTQTAGSGVYVGGAPGRMGGSDMPGVIGSDGGMISGSAIIGGAAVGRSGMDAAASSAEEAPTGPTGGKLLCKTPGCSFYAIPKFENFCLNCYEDYYGVK